MPRANQFSAANQILAATAGVAHEFGFLSNSVVLRNRSGVSMRYSFKSSVATTADAELTPGETLSHYVRTDILALMSTSTPPSSGGSEPYYDVFAFGG